MGNRPPGIAAHRSYTKSGYVVVVGERAVA